MEKLTTLGLSFDRVLIQLIIPGMVAFFPYFFWLRLDTEFLKFDTQSNTALLVTSFTICSLIVGMFLENTGSFIEVKYFDKKNSSHFKNYEDTWFKYLLLNYDGKEPVGHRYIRNILMRMKFELSFAIALIVALPGIFLLNYEKSIVGGWIQLVVIVVVCLAASCYLVCIAARDSSMVLAKTRELLVEQYYKTKV